MTPGILGVDIGGTHLKAGVVDAGGKLLADKVRVATPYPNTPEVMLRALVALVKKLPRYDLIAIDEVGYVPMADLGAEFLFQVIAERAEKAAVILTTNLPFSEWTQV